MILIRTDHIKQHETMVRDLSHGGERSWASNMRAGSVGERYTEVPAAYVIVNILETLRIYLTFSSLEADITQIENFS